MNDVVLGKIMGNVRHHRDIKFATTGGGKEHNHTTTFFQNNCLQ